MNDELSRLANIASDSRYAAGVNSDTVRYSFRVFERYLRGTSILEMGPAEGVMTRLLVDTGKALTVVEGSRAFCDAIAARHPGVEVVHSLFEDYAPAKKLRQETSRGKLLIVEGV